MIFQQSVDDLLIEGDVAKGVVTQTGIRFHSGSVVLTAGTFLGGVIHIGLENHSGGRGRRRFFVQPSAQHGRSSGRSRSGTVVAGAHRRNSGVR